MLTVTANTFVVATRTTGCSDVQRSPMMDLYDAREYANGLFYSLRKNTVGESGTIEIVKVVTFSDGSSNERVDSGVDWVSILDGYGNEPEPYSCADHHVCSHEKRNCRLYVNPAV